MPRDPVIPQWALDERAKWHRRERKLKATFASSQLPQDYPTPRIDSEWEAYCRLRQFWTRPQIKQFLLAYGTDQMPYPGILDTPRCPTTLKEFLRDVGTLAEGEYARSLPKKEMLTHVAGEDAARGAAILEAAAEGGKKRSRERKAATAGRDKAMAEEYLKRIKGAGRRSHTVIREDIGKGHGLKKTASISAINRGLKILSG